MAAETYAPKEINIIVAGAIMTGYAEDTFVSIERSTEAFTKVVGADGKVSRTHSADRSGTIVLTLKQTSPSNDVLSALQIADEVSLNGKFPVGVEDSMGTSIYVGADAWIDKMANSEFAAAEGTREWTISVADLTPFVGSNS